MPVCKRIVARLDVKGSRLIKGIRFEGVRVLGDAQEKALDYVRKGVDEIVYIDSVASLYGRSSLGELLKQTTKEVFVPITAGGGIRSVQDAAGLLSAGADKIAINSAALKSPQILSQLSERFGSQCVVLSVQARKVGVKSWEAMADGGRERSGRDVMNWIEEAQAHGIGEVLLTSVDMDGTCLGTDMDLITEVEDRVSVPLIVGGGVASYEDVSSALSLKRVAGVSIGAALHKSKINISQAKKECIGLGLDLVRQEHSATNDDFVSAALKGKKVGVIDYDMGNVQSLINAFDFIGIETRLTCDLEVLNGCDLLALPGVGAFPAGMQQLRRSGLDHFLKGWVGEGRPLLGICLGMQMLFEYGNEFQHCEGLKILKGTVNQIKINREKGNEALLPHIGWNQLIHTELSPTINADTQLLEQYFVHSFCATQVPESIILYKCKYGSGEAFPAAVLSEKVAGFQFHPERSGKAGIKLLRSVCETLI